jgi:hypothetical protein
MTKRKRSYDDSRSSTTTSSESVERIVNERLRTSIIENANNVMLELSKLIKEEPDTKLDSLSENVQLNTNDHENRECKRIALLVVHVKLQCKITRFTEKKRNLVI